MPNDTTDQLKALSKQIADEFVRLIPQLKPTPEQIAMIGRAATAIGEATIMGIGAPADAVTVLHQKRDMALATLQNIGVSLSLDAAAVMRESAKNVFALIVKAGVGLAGVIP